MLRLPDVPERQTCKIILQRRRIQRCRIGSIVKCIDWNVDYGQEEEQDRQRFCGEQEHGCSDANLLRRLCNFGLATAAILSQVIADAKGFSIYAWMELVDVGLKITI